MFPRPILVRPDVLVESFRPGILEKLMGVDSCDELLAQYPGLVICRITG